MNFYLFIMISRYAFAAEWSVRGYLQARKRKMERRNSVACRETAHGSEVMFTALQNVCKHQIKLQYLWNDITWLSYFT